MRSLCDHITVAHQAPLSMGFSRQEQWSRFPFPLPGDLPDSGIKLISLASPALACGFFTTSAIWDAPSPIASWQIDGGKSGNSDRLYFLWLQNHCEQYYSHEIKRRLLLGRKAMTNLDSILKSRDITLPTRVCIVKAMVFPVVMYGRESWTIKKAEHQRTDAFKLWC